MAVWYVWSGATGTATGASWANAKTTLTAALLAGTAGDTYYVAHDHAEVTAGQVDLQFKGTAAAFDHIYCVNRAGSVPPVDADLRTTATITASGANNLLIGRNTNGYAYVYGISFICSSGASGGTMSVGASTQQFYEACNFTLGSTGGQQCRFGTGGSYLELLGCTLKVGSTSSYFCFDGAPVVFDGQGIQPLTGSVIPSALFGVGSLDNIHGPTVRNCDFTNLGSSGYIWDIRARGTPPPKLENCKLNATPLGFLGGSGVSSSAIHLIGCGTAGNVSRNEIYTYVCNLLTETTIVRTGGASDGVTPYSWKLIPQNGGPNRDVPLETFEGGIWNDVIGSPKTLTFHCLTDGINLQTNELWLEVDYLGSATSPLASRLSTAPATRLTPASNLPSDTGTTWTAPGVASPVKQMLQATFTPQMKGPIRFRLKSARGAGNIYVCPKAELA